MNLSATGMRSEDVDVRPPAPDKTLGDVDGKAPEKNLFEKFLKKNSGKSGADVSDTRLPGVVSLLPTNV